METEIETESEIRKEREADFADDEGEFVDIAS
jgi:hypothetical protein